MSNEVRTRSANSESNMIFFKYQILIKIYFILRWFYLKNEIDSSKNS